MSASLDHWYELPAPDWEHLFYPQRGYHYFRQPLAPRVRSRVADQVTAAWMADTAMLAYGTSGPDLIPLDQFDSFFKNVGLTCHRIGEWSASAKGTQAFFAYNADFAVLSFRCTEKDDWTDSLVDLTILPVRETLDAPSAANKTLFQLGLRNPVLSPLNSKEVGVHAGFQFALNAVWGQVQKNLEDYRGTNPGAPIFFTGHSLGAALATLAITRFNAANLVLFTYGSPRTGNTAFCDKVAKKADLGIHRFVDNCDLVTRVPAKDLFYDHTGGMVHIDQNGNIAPGGAPDDPGELRAIAECLSVAAVAAKDFVSQAPPPGDLVDHSPTRYCYFVWRWARNGQVP